MPPNQKCIFIIVLATVAMHCVTSESCRPIKEMKGLNYLNCSGTGMTRVPEPLDETAEVLDFSNNKFLELPVLKESKECSDTCHVVNDSNVHCRYDISFSRNEIFTFHKHALHGLRCLRTLDLSYNNIYSTVLNDRTFQEGVYHLENLILRGNPLGELPDNVITSPFLRQIRYIDLSHCELEIMGENSIDDHDKLTTLNLSNNNLKEIKQATFKGLKNLRVLDLSHNELTTLGHMVFADLTNLDSLILADNHIHFFAKHAFYRDSHLKSLDVSLNNLKAIPYQALQELTEIKHLILSYNPITSVRSDIILASVQTLELEEMGGLTRLGRRSLASFPSLVTLSIRRNRNLVSIHSEFLPEHAPGLQEVILDSNGLSTLSADALPWKHLTTLRLDANPWVCDYQLKWMIQATVVKTRSVICAGPVQFEGRDIKGIRPVHLQQPFRLTYIIAVIALAIALPAVGIIAFLLWQRRKHFRCCKDVKGRYVSVYTRDGDSESDDRVDIRVRIMNRRLKGVSNGGADDTLPFIEMETPVATEMDLQNKEEEI